MSERDSIWKLKNSSKDSVLLRMHVVPGDPEADTPAEMTLSVDQVNAKPKTYVLVGSAPVIG